MRRKNYECQIPTCDRTVTVRSTIKEGEYRGLKVCPVCKVKYDKGHKGMKKQTEKNRDKRRRERSGLDKFFKDAIEELSKKPFCENCGRMLNMNYNPHWNIGHILPKQRYKSVMSHPDNWIGLCTSKEGGDCHHKFDNDISSIENLKCFEKAKRKFDKFKDQVLERGKIFDIFENVTEK